MPRMSIQWDGDLSSCSEGQQRSILDFEAIACREPQPACVWPLGAEAFVSGLAMVSEDACGGADGAELVVA